MSWLYIAAGACAVLALGTACLLAMCYVGRREMPSPTNPHRGERTVTCVLTLTPEEMEALMRRAAEQERSASEVVGELVRREG